MQTRTRETFTAVRMEGAILSSDLLRRILENDRALDGLSPADYHLARGERLNEATNRAWTCRPPTHASRTNLLTETRKPAVV